MPDFNMGIPEALTLEKLNTFLDMQIGLAKTLGHNRFVIYNYSANCINIFNVDEPGYWSYRIGLNSSEADNQYRHEGFSYEDMMRMERRGLFNEFIDSWRE